MVEIFFRQTHAIPMCGHLYLVQPIHQFLILLNKLSKRYIGVLRYIIIIPRQVTLRGLKYKIKRLKYNSKYVSEIYIFYDREMKYQKISGASLMKKKGKMPEQHERGRKKP